MEFLDNGAICDTSLVSKRTFFHCLENTYTTLYTAWCM